MNTPLFVYGSLRRDLGRLRPQDAHEAAKRLQARGRFLAIAWTRGALITPDWYPGLVDGQQHVRGELWCVDAALLACLDDYEGEDYARRRVQVRLAGGRGAWALAWLWTGSPHGPAISSGDYRAWLRSGRRRASPAQ